MRIFLVYVLVENATLKKTGEIYRLFKSIAPASLEFAKKRVWKTQSWKGTSCFYRCRRADTARNQHMRRMVRLGHFRLDLSGSLLI